MPKLLRLNVDERLFVVLLGVLATILGYQFGMGNQTEHLPLTLRLLDPSYLQNDFYVESAIEFGPRFYYVHLLALLADWLTLPLAVLLLAFVINAALAALTFLAVRDLLGGDRLAGFIAAILVVSVSSFPLGLVTDIRFIDLQPASLAIPGCIAALWAGLRGNAVLAACLAGISCLPHPLYGVETGTIAIATAAFAGLLNLDLRVDRTRLIALAVRILGATAILGGIAVIFWALPQSANSEAPLEPAELFSILAHFRAPHHYIASQFPIEHYVALACFLAAFALCWSKWRHSNRSGMPTTIFLVPPIIVLLACLAGYALTEVWPSRVGVISQPFRMLYIVKWLGFLFLGWQLSTWIGEGGRRAAFGWITLLGSGAAQAVMAFLAVLGERVDARIARATASFPRYLAPVGLLIAAALLLVRAGKIEETLLVFIALGMAFPLRKGGTRHGGRLLSLGLVLLVVSTVLANRANQVVEWQFVNPIVTFSDHRGDSADIARWALENTPESSVFLIPPDMGTFRLLARRAAVVDFVAIPFDGAAMREWRERIRECYGDVTTGGFRARKQLAQNYSEISDQDLARISLKYDADYAVLSVQTQTSRPVVYSADNFKIVPLSHDRN